MYKLNYRKWSMVFNESEDKEYHHCYLNGKPLLIKKTNILAHVREYHVQFLCDLLYHVTGANEFPFKRLIVFRDVCDYLREFHKEFLFLLKNPDTVNINNNLWVDSQRGFKLIIAEDLKVYKLSNDGTSIEGALNLLHEHDE